MYTQQRFILMTLDPVHIGVGGYRLGRVDLSIAREPGSNLPKIPGTSLAGAARSYAAMRYEKLQCAGQGQGAEEKKKHCGSSTCPICYTFGNIRGTDGGNAGTVSLADAQLLLMPVHSMTGPMWVSTKERLDAAGFDVKPKDLNLERDGFATTLPNWNKPLNFGWLMLTHKGPATIKPPQDLQGWNHIESRLALVEDGLFSQIVNSNLEVRTSVSIDAQTGAAKEGALFTYEALPRATWLWCDVVEDDYRAGEKPQWPITKAFSGSELHDQWESPLGVVRGSLKLAEYMGIGGMGTRGFGRVKMVGDWGVSHG